MSSHDKTVNKKSNYNIYAWLSFIIPCKDNPLL